MRVVAGAFAEAYKDVLDVPWVHEVIEAIEQAQQRGENSFLVKVPESDTLSCRYAFPALSRQGYQVTYLDESLERVAPWDGSVSFVRISWGA